MLDSTMIPTKVAVLASSHGQCSHLQTLLEKCGLAIVVNDVLSDDYLDKLLQADAEVLLVDIGEIEDSSIDFVDTITEKSNLPVLFNDSGPEGVNLAASSEIWAKKLAQKLIKLANHNAYSVNDMPIANQAPAVTPTPPPVNTPPPELTPAGVDNVNDAAEAGNAMSDLNIWVLGASLGGPQAVRQFLATVAEDLPVTFILAQHIGANHVNLLAEQLNRVTRFNVVPGKNGHRLSYQEVILAPADKQLSFTDDGFIVLKPAPPGAIYSPSIDNVMSEVANKFGNKAGTIIFSGMGDDGKIGCESIANKGGIVWAQDIASCVVSSMPDHARKTGKVSYSAKPEQLANHLYEFLCP